MGVVTQIAAPVKGWIAHGTPVNADPLTALIMENWFPEAQELVARAGYEYHSSAFSGVGVEWLMPYTSGTDSKLFACGGGEIKDISAGGNLAAAAADVTGLANDEWYHTMFATPAGQFLVCANGEDAVRNYNGSAWSTPTITGVSSSTLIYPHAHASRLWFIQVGTTDLWHLDPISIAGPAQKFSIGAMLDKGGSITAIGTWSMDAGDGMDDFFVVVTSEGEIVVYQGTDPTDADLWSRVGKFSIGKPIGRRCLAKVGGDLAIMSEDGIVSAALALKLDRGVISEKSITAPIRDAYNLAVRRARDVAGWQMITYPLRNQFIVNVPGTGSVPTCQFVMNTATGAWTKFVGMPAECWAYFDGGLYFARSNGRVLHADATARDGADEIDLAVLPAYNHFGARGRQKHVKMCQPIYFSDTPSINPPAVSIAVNYEMPTEGSAEPPALVGYFTWGSSIWGSDDRWYDALVRDDWRGSGNIGYVVSPYTTASVGDADATNLYQYRLTGWTIVYEAGGVL
jgi:hypothetical protein